MKAGSTLPLTAAGLMEMARKQTRLEDFGDEGFRIPLGSLLDSFEKTHGSDAGKRFSFAYVLIDILTKRLHIRDTINSSPGILEIPVKRPLFITGLPRTGTTLLQNLVSQGRCWRVLRYWELLYPYYSNEPGPNNREHFIRLTEQLIEGLYARYPGLIYRHETKAQGPEECVLLLRNSFYSNSFAAEWDLANYLQWYMEQDLTGSYRYYRTLLQLLLRHTPGQHLLLKCPGHLFGLDAILQVFPDANIVWMHRDPYKSIASVLSLYSVFHDGETTFNDFIDLYLNYFSQSVIKAMKLAQSNTAQIKSVSYKQLVENQIEVTREICRHFNYPYDGTQEQNISTWLKENPQHKHGSHKYSLEDFGLTRADIEKRFSRYYETYSHLL